MMIPIKARRVTFSPLAGYWHAAPCSPFTKNSKPAAFLAGPRFRIPDIPA